jgi:hypothetical protein
MFVRNVTLRLKINQAGEFTRLMENEVIPLLRKQTGFRDEIALIAPERSEAVAISFWETKELAEAYNQTSYKEVLDILSKVIDGTPRVETFELSNSTFHKLAAKGA